MDKKLSLHKNILKYTVFSRLYLSYGRAFVVVLLPSVTNVLWLNGAK